MKESKTLNESFVQEIQLLWSAEKLLTEAIPMLIAKAKHPALKKSLAFHLAETDQHKVALEMICKQLGFDHEGNFNTNLKTILDEGEKAISKVQAEESLDETIIEGALKVEQFEMAAYESAATTAEKLAYKPIASRLRLIREEEQQADTKLNFLAKEVVKTKVPLEEEMMMES